jgi:hypothetical protein
MELYHGTNVKFERARILVPNRALDFGGGFYVTSDKEQACGWAHTTEKSLSFLRLKEIVEL